MFTFDPAEAETLTSTTRHKTVTKNDYFCLQMKLMNNHANVIVSMFNWVYNIPGLGGDVRSKEMDTEWKDNKIGYEELQSTGDDNKWPAI